MGGNSWNERIYIVVFQYIMCILAISVSEQPGWFGSEIVRNIDRKIEFSQFPPLGVGGKT
jgi:hypothetical protein